MLTRFDVLLAGLVPRRRRKKNFQNLTSRRTYCEMIFFCACSFAATFLEVFLLLARLSMTTSNNLSGSECKSLKEHSKEGLVYVI